MKPIIYEIKRTLTSRFVIIMMVAIIGLSSLLAYEAASTYSPTTIPSGPTFTVGYYPEGGNIHIVTYMHNAYGQPISNVNVEYSFNGVSYTGTSSANGFANTTLPIANNPNMLIHFNFSYRRFGAQLSASTEIYVPNTSVPSGLEILPGIVDRSNTTRFGFELMYVGAGGSVASPLNLYIGSSTLSSSQIVSNPSFVYTNLSGFTVLNIFPHVTYKDRNTTYNVVATSPSGYIIPYTPGSLNAILTDYTPMTQKALQSLVYSGTSQILGFLIPILSVFVAYLTYGKDRTSGVLESVLKRPVTRGSLISSRFLSNAVSIVIAVIVSMAFADLIIFHYFHMYLTAYFSLYFIWTYIVEGVAFLGIVYLFSHLVRSQGAVLGAAIGVFVVMDLFWSVISLSVLAGLGIPNTSNNYVYGTLAFDYASPAGYSNVVQILFTKSLGLFSAITIVPSSFGVTTPTLLLVGILWIAVPFLIAVTLAKMRD
ncbi:MAG: ABC transporter permease subunit [Methanomassiliicoccales archaeon]